uniref:Small ribosomal subunit protein uS17c n=1 Tax=Rhodogorgon sp. TaxID=2485824 RepID=A0A3G3MHX3_9FLOR|nr:ribosomal protein S17 [Rhodogorgon sp.]
MTIKETVGTITSSDMNKTVIVTVFTKISHKKYNKIVCKTNKYYAHNENNKHRKGDKVKIRASRPISKNKHWIVIRKVN